MEKVFVAQCREYDYEKVENAVVRIFESFGGAEEILKQGKRVLLKVNLLLPRKPEGAATTHPYVAAAVAKYLISHGAQVTIADSPGGPYTQGALKRTYDICGMTEAAEMSGASLSFDTTQKSKTAKLDGETKVFDIITPAADCDVIISCAKLKTHSLAYFTGAAKNMFGVIAGLNKAVYHTNYPKTEDFAAAMVDIVRTVTPHFSIIDGVIGMEGNGPSGGTPKAAGVIIGSKNPFAADEAAMLAASLDPALAPIQNRAKELGLLDGIEICGDDAPKVSFEPALKGKRMWKALRLIPKSMSKAIGERMRPYPFITDKCIGCATCADACPGKALRIENKKAILKKKQCIKCYCCHELCPVKAIDMR